MTRTAERTQVGIIGAGPAGLVLSHLLHLAGIDSVVLEHRDRDYVESRVRAGVLEHHTAELLRDIGVGDRMDRESLVHHGINMQVEGELHRIDLTELSGGKSIIVYGQQEVVKDLIATRLDDGGQILFESPATEVVDAGTEEPAIRYTRDGDRHELRCDVIVGCDGFHGVSRDAIPENEQIIHDYEYPYGWLGVLAEYPPPLEELVYARHERGFALISMRSTTLSRMYLQCRPDEKIDDWSDEDIWSELSRRQRVLDRPGFSGGPILERGITPMRCFVAETMRHGNLFLAGDAAHIVPPAGAKGMNLAIADVRVLADALVRWYRTGSTEALDAYPQTCLRRVWQTMSFSNWMTRMLHPNEAGTFENRLTAAELRRVATSRAASRNLAEQYVGLPPTSGVVPRIADLLQSPNVTSADSTSAPPTSASRGTSVASCCSSRPSVPAGRSGSTM